MEQTTSKKTPDPWTRLMRNVMLSSDHGAGGGSKHNPKNREGKTKGTQSTKRHAVHITKEDLKQKFLEQGGRCYWFGIELDPDSLFIPHFPMALSVDRLDNDKDYVYDNIVICCRLANTGRGKCCPALFAQLMLALSKVGLSPDTEKLEELIKRFLSKPSVAITSSLC